MKTIYFLILILSLAILNSCKKQVEYPLEPILVYDTIRVLQFSNPIAGQITDSVVIDVDFTDGDGNIGVAVDAKANDTSNYNFFYTPYILVKGKWEKIFELYTKIPNLNSSGKATPLRGKISADITDAFYLYKKKDTMRVEIYVKDNAGNKSNVVTSSLFSGLQN
jgi:DUF4097 and DUF4098 domain-containing protein YvlB